MLLIEQYGDNLVTFVMFTILKKTNEYDFGKTTKRY